MLVEDGASFSIGATRNAIQAAGFDAAKPTCIPMVTETNKVKHVEFCADLVRRNVDFSDEIFSDESTIKMNAYNQYGYKTSGAMNIHLPKPKHPLKLHVWGGMSRRGATTLMVF